MTMNILEADERVALCEAVNRLLKDKSSEADVRRIMELEAGYDQDVWKQWAEMGLCGLIVPPEYGGAGASAVEVEAVMEEVGASLLCSPHFASSILSAGLLGYCDDKDAQARLLPAIADGSTIATLALTGDSGLWTEDSVDVTADETSADVQLSGVAAYVNYAHIANVLIVVARGENGIDVYEVDPTAAGVEISAMKTFDRTQRLSRIVFDKAPALKVGEGGWDQVEKTLNLARIALAGEQAGGGEYLFNMTIEYIKNRFQFGRAIGGFQAIKHMAADLLLHKESAISAARHAARGFAEEAEGAGTAISLAAFACSDAYSKIAFDSIQMHGGIGFTWEYPAHLYVRRARATAQFLGKPSFYRERYIQQMGG